MKTVAIIGAGLGGLSAAIRLARAGFSVHVYEKNARPGGKAQTLTLGDFHFDTGPSVITLPDVIADLFLEAGEDIKDHLNLKPLDLSCQYFYEDRSRLRAFRQPEDFVREIEQKSSDSPEQLRRYFQHVEGLYKRTRDVFLHNCPREFLLKEGVKNPGKLTQCMFIDCFRSMHKANSDFFSDERLIQIFDRYATYNGSNPYKAPATLNVIAYVEHLLGTYYNPKGVFNLVESLYNLALKLGVHFEFNSRVKRILYLHNFVSGVRVGKANKKYDIVVSNLDVDKTIHKLVNCSSEESNLYRRQKHFSSSAIVFYWGVQGQHPDLDVNNILFGKNYADEFADISEWKACPHDPTVYIHISSKYNPSFAPKGCENWFVMVNVPVLQNHDWLTEANSMRKIIKAKVKRMLNIDLNQKILEEATLTPKDLEANVGDVGGRIYGLSSNSIWSAFLRPYNRYGPVKGLYFCGGSTHPGGGIPLVLLSGKIVRDMIVKDNQ